MPWVKFNSNYDWKLNMWAVTAYKAGTRHLVSQACADAAIAAGKAVADTRPEPDQQRRRTPDDASR